jgi:hypothetical protein
MSKDDVISTPIPPKFHLVVNFQNIRSGLPRDCFYDVVDFRAPKTGEYFLAGPTMSIGAYAGYDFADTAQYWIVHPTNIAEKRWYKGEKV